MGVNNVNSVFNFFNIDVEFNFVEFIQVFVFFGVSSIGGVFFIFGIIVFISVFVEFIVIFGFDSGNGDDIFVEVGVVVQGVVFGMVVFFGVVVFLVQL